SGRWTPLAAQHRDRAECDLKDAEGSDKQRGPRETQAAPIIPPGVDRRPNRRRRDQPVREGGSRSSRSSGPAQSCRTSREVGDRQPRTGLPHRRGDENLCVDCERWWRWPGGQTQVVDLRVSTFHSGDVKSAIATVMLKKIPARPACAVDNAIGRLTTTGASSCVKLARSRV